MNLCIIDKIIDNEKLYFIALEIDCKRGKRYDIANADYYVCGSLKNFFYNDYMQLLKSYGGFFAGHYMIAFRDQEKCQAALDKIESMMTMRKLVG